MKKQAKWPVRILYYVLGILIMTMGIALSVKSNLGVSPVSAVPYSITLIWGIEMGIATIIFQVILVVAQIILLRKAFQIKNLLQIPAGILFGVFTSACNQLVAQFPDPHNIGIRIAMMFISTVLIAIGIFFYVPADIIPLAGEGTMLAISEKTGVKFSNVKLCFDIGTVLVAFAMCWIGVHQFGSVGVGTLVAAVLVGVALKVITKIFGGLRDRVLYPDTEEVEMTPVQLIMKREVYTLSPEMCLKEALTYLVEHKISGAPVVNENNKMVGFLSDGDIMRLLAKDDSLYVHSNDIKTIGFNEKLSGLIDLRVKDIAVKRVISVDAGMNLDEVCRILADNKLKKAPVVQNGKMIGIINVSNITKYTLQMIH